MSLRCLLVVAVALLTVQGGGAEVAEALADAAKKALEAAREAAIGVVTRVGEALHTLQQRLEQQAQEAAQRLRDSVSQAVAALRQRIKEAVDRAVQEGRDVEHCVAAVPKAIEDFNKNLVEGAAGCVTREVGDGEKIIGRLIELVKQANATFVEAQETLQNKCAQESSLLQGICQITTISAAVGAETQIAMQAGQEIRDGEQLITHFGADVASCEQTAFRGAEAEAEAIFANLTMCLRNAVIPHTQAQTTAAPQA